MKDPQQEDKEKQLTIVGIGASAGGLDALKRFFSSIPDDTGLAYVIVVHLSPEHKSVLAELLQPHVNMPVMQVTKTIPLKANHVYVIPPNANLNTIDTHLRLSELEEKRRDRAPIDHFFRTLAKTHEGSAVGIILTGTGSDGTLGLQEIKEKGGLTIVQDPKDAEYDGMPLSAISTGQVDMVLPVKDIGPYFLRFVKTQPKLKGLQPGEESDKEEMQLLHKIFAQVRARTGRDFSRYKLSTIMRRLQRRMQLYQMEKLEDYLEFLRKNPEEVRALSDEFLINVTSFFRDAPVYDYLKDSVFPRLFEKRKADEQLRIWSVGCATGEEAYSLGMLMMEEASSREEVPSLQIFASDLHEASLQKAREGFFPGDIQADLSPERLRRFFIKEDGGYRIRKELRELVIFTPHNLLSDPPFSKIDLIVCRNLLIYIKRDVQRDVFELFHYALRPEGFLLLGSSEHLESNDLFRTDNKELSVHIKRNVTGPEPRLPVFPKMRRYVPEQQETHKEQHSMSYDMLHQKMLERYAPPSILLSPDFQIMHVSEQAGRYLAIGGGELSSDIFKLIRPELSMELRSLIYADRENKKLMRSKPIDIRLDGEQKQVILSARIQDETDHENVVLVMFEEFEEPEVETGEGGEHSGKAYDTDRVKELEQELSVIQQRLQAIIEEYETSREEMKASNEELQSANEELETSKEELQSMNEELTTLNQENRHKVEELGQLNDDLQNLLSATDIATLFLDRDLRILRFTPKLGELFNVRPVDRGRPISDQTHRLGYTELVKDAQMVLRKLVPVEREVREENGRFYNARMLPYRSSDDRIEGVVITFVDITTRKQAEVALTQSREKLRIALDAARMGVWSLDLISRQAETTLRHNQIFGFPEGVKEWNTQTARETIIPEDREKFDKAFEQALNTGILDVDFRVQWADGSIHWVQDRGHTYYDEAGKPIRLTGVTVEITNRKQVSEASRKSDERYRSIYHKMQEGFCLLETEQHKEERDFRIREVNEAFGRLTRLSQVEGQLMSQLSPDWHQAIGKLLPGTEASKLQLPSPGTDALLEVEVIPLDEAEPNSLALLIRPLPE